MSDNTIPQGGSRIRELIEAAERLIDQHRHTPLTMAQIATEAGLPESVAREIVPDEKAMIDVLADMAITHLLDSISRRTVAIDTGDALERLRAIAEGFMEWAMQRPHEFLLAADRNLVTISNSAALKRLNDSVLDLLHRSIKEAQTQGRLNPTADLDTMAVTGRALVYGLARMSIDGHFEEWAVNPESDPQEIARKSFDLYLDAMSQKAGTQ
ncbi:MAG: TetR-like C-terminal domain-containing protein [Paracoccus sp. (in: a-proteobacteria)]|uniref:TetR/AcrR family transcriptional regulator n=1 Tax=Paracoccus sp. TaxID=267 RepID=UPI0026DFBEA0|nr:TetR-like C-terminal domain-containing protein [Paracoccus sp. (in: a-proteobacteria)]MDO5612124.1 TetR-like C-terminal domain-containing protein [Paracoccus sp. (in: a-proteobacteria)]